MVVCSAEGDVALPVRNIFDMELAVPPPDTSERREVLAHFVGAFRCTRQVRNQLPRKQDPTLGTGLFFSLPSPTSDAGGQPPSPPHATVRTCDPCHQSAMRAACTGQDFPFFLLARTALPGVSSHGRQVFVRHGAEDTVTGCVAVLLLQMNVLFALDKGVCRVLGVLRRVLGVLCSVVGVLRSVVGVLRSVVGVLRRALQGTTG